MKHKSIISVCILALLAPIAFIACGGSSSGSAAPATKLTFVTNITFTGDLVTEEGNVLTTGIAAADALCMADSNYPGTGTYKALIVDGVNRVASVTANAGDGQVDWVLKPRTTYYRSDGTTKIMTTDASGIFVFGALDNSINGAGALYMTGIDSDWTLYDVTAQNENCNGWTYGGINNGTTAAVGRLDQTSSAAITFTSGGWCSTPLALVCVQQ